MRAGAEGGMRGTKRLGAICVVRCATETHAFSSTAAGEAQAQVSTGRFKMHRAERLGTCRAMAGSRVHAGSVRAIGAGEVRAGSIMMSIA